VRRAAANRSRVSRTLSAKRFYQVGELWAKSSKNWWTRESLLLKKTKIANLTFMWCAMMLCKRWLSCRGRSKIKTTRRIYKIHILWIQNKPCSTWNNSHDLTLTNIESWTRAWESPSLLKHLNDALLDLLESARHWKLDLLELNLKV
jgi:hypothetical protein